MYQVALCTYYRYEAKRVILRQGHVAEAFYILLSGTILINAQERGHPVVKEVSAGGTFGVRRGTQILSIKVFSHQTDLSQFKTIHSDTTPPYADGYGELYFF